MSSTVPSPPARTRRHGRGTRIPLAAVVVLLSLPSCAKRDAKSEMGRVRSWTATTKLAIELRGVRATNRAVTKQLLDRAERTRAKEAKQLATLAKTDSQRAAARGLLDSLRRGIIRLQAVAR